MSEINLHLTTFEVSMILVALNSKFEEFSDCDTSNQMSEEYLRVYEQVLSQVQRNK